MPSNLLRPIRRRRLSQLAAEQINALIEHGQYASGEQLPSERELATQLAVSRAAVREALRVLEAKGIVRVQPGKGAYVLLLATQPDVQSCLMVWLEQHQEILEVVYVGRLLDSYAATVAAQRVTDADVDRLQQVLTEMDLARERKATGELVAHDRMFHRLIYEMTGNRFLVMLADSVQGTLADMRFSTLGIADRASNSVEEHHAILAAIAAGDSESAHRAACLHIDNVLDLLATIEPEWEC